ncbi:MAG TPA: hypothetical protein VNN07_14035 [Candidatus Tectomicrobia bacterium]|nr:hypothetical protein [Candidatus Tectomicrobia bacterium]
MTLLARSAVVVASTLALCAGAWNVASTRNPPWVARVVTAAVIEVFFTHLD